MRGKLGVLAEYVAAVRGSVTVRLRQMDPLMGFAAAMVVMAVGLVGMYLVLGVGGSSASDLGGDTRSAPSEEAAAAPGASSPGDGADADAGSTRSSTGAGDAAAVSSSTADGIVPGAVSPDRTVRPSPSQTVDPPSDPSPEGTGSSTTAPGGSTTTSPPTSTSTTTVPSTSPTTPPVTQPPDPASPGLVQGILDALNGLL